MSNPIKYNTGSETNALKKGNFYIGTRDVPKGPTSQTGFYTGLTPPSGGYTVYVNKASGGPAVYVAANDAELISLTNKIAGTSYSTLGDALNYYSTQTDKIVLNRDYPKIATDGLILYLDAGNVGSYPRGTSILDVSSNLKPTKNSIFLNMSNWALGPGGVTGYSQNGLTSENERVMGTDPWGNSTIVWEARPSGDGVADGGWNTGYYTIDKTKLYRFSVWVKRTSNTSGGTSYLGLYDTVNRLDGGGVQSNPYWQCAPTSTYVKDVWYLLVGHCYPYGTTGISNNKHPDSGRYTVNGRDGDLNYCNVGGDVTWLVNSTQTLHRTYLYYCSDSTTRLQWFDPRIDLCDGTEPTIEELLKKTNLCFFTKWGWMEFIKWWCSYF